ncbi:MAG: tRNA (cytidine(34)-2'-O)-methyltransferase [Lachnospiraceae bacterium]|nr:tRNA (cytidine(34)-2'-O)-methyltransferase [Lachnospiraceae bacterium]
MFNIVLLEPEIPANTGNIGRTCLCTGSKLHLIEPMGFIINDKNLKRAGMDYWNDLDVTIYDSWRDFIEKNKDKVDIFGSGQPLKGKEKSGKAKLWMATTKAKATHDQAPFEDGDYIMFGKESAGIPEEILMDNKDTCIRIPMAKEQRSLNLSNSVAVVLYEALRQNAYLDLETEGQLHHHTW